MFTTLSPLRRAVTTLSLVALGTTALVGLHSPAGATVGAPAHWMPVSTGAGGPSARYDAAMAYDATTNTTILFGGFNGSALGETWSWNGSLWTELSPTVSPPPLRGAAMAYDALTRNIVLFGGSTSTGPVADTWVFDGANWTHQIASGPAARDGASLTYDYATRNLVLFGGRGVAGPLADTWFWNGSAWTTPTLTEPSPPARYEQSMVYDGWTHDVVLYGGMGASGPIADTWSFDGANWSPELSANPPARYGASMFYDATTHNVVMFAGSNATTQLSETWAWNGSSWSTVPSSTAPTSRILAATAYDTLSNSAVLFGGDAATAAASDTWNFVDLPTPPFKVHATSNNNGQSVLTWSVPTSTGGTVIYAYSATASDLTVPSRGGQTCSTIGTTMVTISSTSPVPTTCTVTGLTNGDQYRFAVTATSLVGTGGASWSNVVRPATVSSTPTFTSVVAVPHGAQVSWSVPVDMGGTPVASYRVTASPGGAFCHVPRRLLSCRIGGLVNGVTYTFTISAANAAGTSAPSTPSTPITLAAPVVTPVPPVTTPGSSSGRRVTLPGAPLIVSKVVAGRYVTIRWVAPLSNGGVRLSGYNIYVGPTAYGAAYRPMVPVAFNQFAYRFALLRGQSAYVVVRAVNIAGVGPFSNQVVVRVR